MITGEDCMSVEMSRLHLVGTGAGEGGGPRILVLLRYTRRAGGGGRYKVSIDNTIFSEAPIGLRVESIGTATPSPESGSPIDCALDRVGFGGDRMMRRGLSAFVPSDSTFPMKFIAANHVHRVLDIDGGNVYLDTTNFSVCGDLKNLDYAIHLSSRNARTPGRQTHLLNNVRMEGTTRPGTEDDVAVPSPLFLSVEDGCKVVCNGFGEAQYPLPKRLFQNDGRNGLSRVQTSRQEARSWKAWKWAPVRS